MHYGESYEEIIDGFERKAYASQVRGTVHAVQQHQTITTFFIFEIIPAGGWPRNNPIIILFIAVLLNVMLSFFFLLGSVFVTGRDERCVTNKIIYWLTTVGLYLTGSTDNVPVDVPMNNDVHLSVTAQHVIYEEMESKWLYNVRIFENGRFF